MDGPKLNGSAEERVLAGRSRGQAALLLVESLMHTLLAKNVISREDFIETVDGAAEVDHDLKIGNAPLPADISGSLLSPLAAAFKKELGR